MVQSIMDTLPAETCDDDNLNGEPALFFEGASSTVLETLTLYHGLGLNFDLSLNLPAVPSDGHDAKELELCEGPSLHEIPSLLSCMPSSSEFNL